MLVCDTKQVLLEWDFSSTNKVMKIEMTRSPYGLGPLMTSSPESCTARHSVLKSQSIWMAETRENILIGHKASSQKMKQEERKKSSSFYMGIVLDKQKSLPKQTPV